MTRAGAVTPLFLAVVFPLALLGCAPKAYPQCGQDSGAQCGSAPEAQRNPPEATPTHDSEPNPDALRAAIVASSTGDDIIPFGAPMTPPEKLSGPAPEYTKDALEHRIEGTMLVQCVITREGEARKCRIIQPVRYLEQAVLSSLAQSRFKPATLDGKPVSVTYTLSFKLQPPSPQKAP